MRKLMVAVVAIMLASLAMASTANAQDAVRGTVTADPASVAAAGEQTFTATGADFIPDTSVLLVKCVSPGDTLVFGVSTTEEIVASGESIDALADCDLSAAQNVDVDGDGNWSAELTAEVGDNFWLSAGALDGSQAGATWVPIVSAEAVAAGDDDLADTGVETGLMAVIGAAVLAAGVMVAREGRRHS